MADVTPEQRAEWRKDAEKHAPGSDPKRDRILSLLDALEATEQELRQRELHHFETEQMLADAEARVAAAEREALERAARIVREFADTRGVNVGDEDDEWWHGYRQAQRECVHDAARIVRDLMPRKDGE